MGFAQPRKKQAISMAQVLGPLGIILVGIPVQAVQVALPSSIAPSPAIQTDIEPTTSDVDCLPQQSQIEPISESQGMSEHSPLPPLASATLEATIPAESTFQPFIELNDGSVVAETDTSQPLLAQAEFDPLCCQQGPASCFLGGVPEGGLANLAGGFPFAPFLGALPLAGLFGLLGGDDDPATTAATAGAPPSAASTTSGGPGGGPGSPGSPGSPGIGDPGGGAPPSANPVPEPLSMVGPLVALVFGTYIKRKGLGNKDESVD